MVVVSRGAGFTLLEVIITVAILAVLAGVAAPYYSEYIGDAREAALKSNIATFRKAMADFITDNGRGPYNGTIYVGTDLYDCTFGNNANNELVAGVVPTPALWTGGITYRRNKYLSALPDLINANGERLTIVPASWSIVFVDGGGSTQAGILEVDKDSWYFDTNANKKYTSGVDVLGSGTTGVLAAAAATFTADVTWIDFQDSTGRKY